MSSNTRSKRNTTAAGSQASASKATKAKEKGQVKGGTSKQAGKRVQTQDAPSKKKPHHQEQAQSSQENLRSTTIEYTDKQLADFECFKKINMCPTRFLSKPFLEKVGIEEDVRKMIENMGLTKFSETRHFVHPELVKDFFATVELKYKKPRKPKPQEGVVSFVIWDKPYSLTIEEFCEVYGFNNGSEAKFGEFDEADTFWDTIAIGSAEGNPKSGLLRNPAIRYVHKFLSNTFFARKATGGVRRDELWLLFKGVRSFLVDEDGEMYGDVVKDDVNLGCLFAKELVKTRAWGRLTTEPSCYMGGLLTTLFRRVGIDLQCYYQDQQRASLDRTYFLTCGFLEDTKDRREYRYLYLNRSHQKRALILPNTTLTSLTSLANIWFEHEGEAPTVLTQKEKSPQDEQPPTDELQNTGDPWELPELKIKPKTTREKIFFSAYNMQKKINKMAKNKFNWLKSKLKKLPGYVSDEDEFLQQEEARESSRGQEAQGDQHVVDEGRSSYQGARNDQEEFDATKFDYQARSSYVGDYGTDHFFPTTYDLGGSSSYHP